MPARQPVYWELSTATHCQDFFYARVFHRTERVDVVGFARHTVPGRTLSGREFCPFLGARDGAHIYVTGTREHLEVRGANREQRLVWLVTLARATAAAHAVDQSVGLLKSLWVDPNTQELAVADYYYSQSRAPAAADIARLGKIGLDWLGEFADQDCDFFERCLDPNACVTAQECEQVFQGWLDQCRSSSHPSHSYGLSSST